MAVLRNLFGGRRPPAPRAPDGAPIYAVGDIHGRADLLADLLAAIAGDAGGARHELIFLGDYVDRGPDSRGVIDLILGASANPAVTAVAIKGNHEEAMLEFLADATFGPVWAQHGGGATLLSYGVEPPSNRMDHGQWERARLALLGALPSAHLAFLNGLQLFERRGDYLFVHAGIRPGVPLEDQSARDMMWIRREFLDHGKPLGHVVVHGHTPESEPFEGVHRIGVDTGAYYSGRLTAVRLSGDTRGFVQAKGERGASRDRISGFAQS